MKKKWYLASMLALVLAVTTACSDGNSDVKDKEKAPASEEQAGSKADSKSEAMDFYMQLISKINENDADLNSYENAAGAEEPPAAEELAEMKKKAAASAENTAKAVKEMTVPNVGDAKADFDSGLAKLAESYEMKAEELKKDGEPALDAANEKFAEADEAVGTAMEKTGLTKATLGKDING